MWIPALLLILCMSTTAGAQVVDGVEIVKPKIHIGEWDAARRSMPVAIEFTIEDGWHMYWLNPGDDRLQSMDIEKGEDHC